MPQPARSPSSSARRRSSTLLVRRSDLLGRDRLVRDDRVLETCPGVEIGAGVDHAKRRRYAHRRHLSCDDNSTTMGKTLAQRRPVLRLDPLRVVLARPRLVDLAGGHAAQRVARARMDQRQVEVPDEQADGEEREDVVDGAGAVEDEAVVALAEPEEEAGQREQERERDGQQGVDLLAGVEPPLRRPPAASASGGRHGRSSRSRASPRRGACGSRRR